MTKGIKTFLYNSVVSSAKAYDMDYETVISELEQRRDSIKQRIATLESLLSKGRVVFVNEEPRVYDHNILYVKDSDVVDTPKLRVHSPLVQLEDGSLAYQTTELVCSIDPLKCNNLEVKLVKAFVRVWHVDHGGKLLKFYTELELKPSMINSFLIKVPLYLLGYYTVEVEFLTSQNTRIISPKYLLKVKSPYNLVTPSPYIEGLREYQGSILDRELQVYITNSPSFRIYGSFEEDELTRKVKITDFCHRIRIWDIGPSADDSSLSWDENYLDDKLIYDYTCQLQKRQPHYVYDLPKELDNDRRYMLVVSVVHYPEGEKDLPPNISSAAPVLFTTSSIYTDWDYPDLNVDKDWGHWNDIQS